MLYKEGHRVLYNTTISIHCDIYEKDDGPMFGTEKKHDIDIPQAVCENIRKVILEINFSYGRYSYPNNMIYHHSVPQLEEQVRQVGRLIHGTSWQSIIIRLTPDDNLPQVPEICQAEMIHWTISPLEYPRGLEHVSFHGWVVPGLNEIARSMMSEDPVADLEIMYDALYDYVVRSLIGSPLYSLGL